MEIDKNSRGFSSVSSSKSIEEEDEGSLEAMEEEQYLFQLTIIFMSIFFFALTTVGYIYVKSLDRFKEEEHFQITLTIDYVIQEMLNVLVIVLTLAYMKKGVVIIFYLALSLRIVLDLHALYNAIKAHDFNFLVVMLFISAVSVDSFIL